MNQGWQCPGCSSCYAPHVNKCPDCGGLEGQLAMPTPTPAPWINGGQVMQRCNACGDSFASGSLHACTGSTYTNADFMNQKIGFRLGEDVPETYVFSDGSMVTKSEMTRRLADSVLAEIDNRIARS